MCLCVSPKIIGRFSNTVQSSYLKLHKLVVFKSVPLRVNIGDATSRDFFPVFTDPLRIMRVSLTSFS